MIRKRKTRGDVVADEAANTSRGAGRSASHAQVPANTPHSWLPTSYDGEEQGISTPAALIEKNND